MAGDRGEQRIGRNTRCHRKLRRQLETRRVSNVRRYRRTTLQLGAVAAALSLLALGCGSSKSSSSGGGSGGGATAGVGLQINNPNNKGTPITGGTLTALGTSDVDNALDP